MKVILDSNVLFRTLISGGDILDIIFNNNLKMYAPLKLKEEFLNNKEEILSKSRLSEKEFEELYSLIFERISFIEEKEYSSHITKAKELLNEHEKDIEFVAISLLKNIKIWTYESRLFKIEKGVSTKEISKTIASE